MCTSDESDKHYITDRTILYCDFDGSNNRISGQVRFVVRTFGYWHLSAVDWLQHPEPLDHDDRVARLVDGGIDGDIQRDETTRGRVGSLEGKKLVLSEVEVRGYLTSLAFYLLSEGGLRRSDYRM